MKIELRDVGTDELSRFVQSIRRQLSVGLDTMRDAVNVPHHPRQPGASADNTKGIENEI